jgi:hypothetical protein
VINRHQLQSILDFVEQQGLSEQTITQLRQTYPGCHFTYCMDDDVNFPRVYAERPHFNVYLVDSREHCSTLTTDAEVASGVVLAEVIGE